MIIGFTRSFGFYRRLLSYVEAELPGRQVGKENEIHQCRLSLAASRHQGLVVHNPDRRPGHVLVAWLLGSSGYLVL